MTFYMSKYMQRFCSYKFFFFFTIISLIFLKSKCYFIIIFLFLCFCFVLGPIPSQNNFLRTYIRQAVKTWKIKDMFYSKIICVLIVIVVMNMWIKDGSFIARKYLFRLPPMQCMHSDYAVCSDLAELLGKKKSLSNTSLNVRKNIMTYSVLGVPDLQK